MRARRLAGWLSVAGLFLVVAGVGFIVGHDRPYVTVGVVFCGVGLGCTLIPGWIDFGRGAGRSTARHGSDWP